MPRESQYMYLHLPAVDEISGIYSDFFGIQMLAMHDRAHFSRIAEVCSQILRQRVQRNQQLSHYPENTVAVLESQLEVHLYDLMGNHSSFWHKYYARKQHAQMYCTNFKPDHTDVNHVGNIARCCFPSYYILADVIYYSGRQSRSSHELLLQSLECHLKGQLYKSKGEYAAAITEFKKALKLLGGGPHSLYRELLTRLIGQNRHPSPLTTENDKR